MFLVYTYSVPISNVLKITDLWTEILHAYKISTDEIYVTSFMF